jgi:hypothetical protein
MEQDSDYQFLMDYSRRSQIEYASLQIDINAERPFMNMKEDRWLNERMLNMILSQLYFQEQNSIVKEVYAQDVLIN